LAFQGNDVSPEKRTGYFVDGKEIILSKTRGRPMTGKGILPLPETKKIEVASVLVVTGSFKKTAELTKLTEGTIRGWNNQEWFQNLMAKIRKENDQIIDAKSSKIIHGALEQIEDRLENGDHVVLKTGEVIRKPVSIRDLALVSAITIDKRQLLRGLPTSRTENMSSETQLARLAENFKSLAEKGKPQKEVVVVEDVEYTEVNEKDKEI
jgi:hypothetical protein